jgi:hypothetical protein
VVQICRKKQKGNGREAEWQEEIELSSFKIKVHGKTGAD